MMRNKVQYIEGNNGKFNFYIIAKKKEMDIDKSSLVFNIDKDCEKSLQIEHIGTIGNFDLLLGMETKDGNFKGYILCDEEDVQNE